MTPQTNPHEASRHMSTDRDTSHNSILQHRFVLVIDDNLELLDLMREAFESAGATVSTAADGLTGMRRFEEDPADLVVTDILMPTREGIETIIGLKERNPGVKIIAVSGGGRLGSMDFLKLARQLGADATLAKPFQLTELIEQARSLLAV